MDKFENRSILCLLLPASYTQRRTLYDDIPNVYVAEER